MLSDLPIAETDDILSLEPPADGLGYAASISRQRGDGERVWTTGG